MIRMNVFAHVPRARIPPDPQHVSIDFMNVEKGKFDAPFEKTPKGKTSASHFGESHA